MMIKSSGEQNHITLDACCEWQSGKR